MRRRGRLDHAIQDLHPIRSYFGHEAALTSVVWIDDGLLASAAADGTIRLWRIETAESVSVLHAISDGWAAFHPQGRYRTQGDGVRETFWHVIGLHRYDLGSRDDDDKDLRAGDESSVLQLARRPGS